MQLIMNMMLSSLGQEGLGYVQRWYVPRRFYVKSDIHSKFYFLLIILLLIFIKNP